MKGNIAASKYWHKRTQVALRMIAVAIFYNAIIATLSHASEVSLDSNEASTEISTYSEGKREVLGVTPITLKNKNLEGKTLVAEKNGFAPVYIPFFQNPKSHAEIKVELKRLNNWMPEEINTRVQQNSETIVDQVFFAQSLLEEKKFKEALEVTESLRTQFPGSISIRILFANALLMNGQSSRARGVYKTLLEDIPEQRKQLRAQVEALSKRLKTEGD